MFNCQYLRLSEDGLHKSKAKEKEKQDFMFLRRSATIDNTARDWKTKTRRPSSEHLMSSSPEAHIQPPELSSIPNQKTDFWKRHFESRTKVSWEEFRSCFLQDYGTLICEFSSNRVNWFFSILHMDIFEGRDLIYKMHYDKYCGRSNHNPDRLWLKVKQYATERIFREGVVESLFG